MVDNTQVLEQLAAMASQQGANGNGNGRQKLTTEDYDKYVILDSSGGVVFSQVDGLKLEKLPEDQRSTVAEARNIIKEAIELLGFEFKPRGASQGVSKESVSEARKRLEGLRKALA
jgi:hypothetical protein